MVKQTYQYIAEKLQALKLFEVIFPYAEIIDTTQGAFPAYYKGAGNYQPINLSSYSGCAYLRKSAPITFEKSLTESLIGCTVNEQATVSIKLVAAIKKDVLNIDHAFGSEIILEEVYKALQGRSSAMSDCIGVKDAEVVFISTETDRIKIVSSEYTDSREIPYDWIMFSADIIVKLMFDKNCIQAICEGYTDTDLECLPCLQSEIISPPSGSTSDPLAIYRNNAQPPSVNISWNSKKIIDLADGAAATDAINKGQLDAAISGVSIPDATPLIKGKAKLYADLSGFNTDGAPDQKSVRDALLLKEDKLCFDEASFLLFQDGINDPEYIENCNRLGVNISTFQRTGQGVFLMTFDANLSNSNDNIHIEIHNSFNSAPKKYLYFAGCNFTGLPLKEIMIEAWNMDSGGLDDDAFYYTPFTIRVKRSG
jgi:hypothetical protein